MQRFKFKLIIFQNGYIDPAQIIPNKLNTSQNCTFTLNKERSQILKDNGLKAFCLALYNQILAKYQEQSK